MKLIFYLQIIIKAFYKLFHHYEFGQTCTKYAKYQVFNMFAISQETTES